MPLVDLVMPKMGESITEATILKWHKQPGDTIKQDETLLEIATDKVDTEVPSIAEGVLEEILYPVNDVVPVGAVIARIRTVGVSTHAGPTHDSSSTSQGASALQTEAPPPPIRESQSVASHESSSSHQQSSSHESQSNGNGSQNAQRFYSPLVLNIAASEGIRLSELENIRGTGNEGRVSKKDILQYLAERKSGGPRIETRHTAEETTARSTSIPQPTSTASAATYSGNVEIIEMDRMRKMISEHMVRSKHTSPHVTSFTEADVTNLVHWRDKMKKGFEQREGGKLTFTPLFIEAVVRCIKKYPLINSSLDGEKIILKKDINIGMATAMPNGNLIVPVIRNADYLNLVGLAKQVNSLAENARQNRLRPDDTQGGTFTMTNVGTFGSLMGTPIINQPQVAILAIGAIKKRPVVIESPEGDSIGIRHMMWLSLSYDHRIIDGSLGATFLTAIAKELESFSPDREI